MSETRPGSESGGVAVSGTTTNVRAPMPQVQVIHQPVHSPPYMPNFPYNQQQLMLQSAAVQAAMQAGAMNPQLNMAAMQGRPPSASPKSPGVLSPSPTAGVTSVSSAQVSTSSAVPSSSSGNGKTGSNGSKGLVSQAGISQGQATPLIGGKPVFSTQAVPSLLVGQIGVLPGQGGSGNPAFVSQSKSQSACHTVVSQPQLINSQSPLRMNSQSQLVTSGGQIFTSQPMLTNPAMLQAMANLQQGIPLATHQPLLATQSPTILAGQPLYIRTATPLPQQTMVPAPTANPAGMQPASMNSLKSAKLLDMTSGLQAKTVGIPSKNTNQSNKGLSTILPSTSKGSNTAKIHPTNMSMQQHAGAKLNIPTITPKQATKVRTKKSNPSSIASQTKPSTPTSLSKPATPTSQTNGTVSLPKSQSDSEVETGRKTVALIDTAEKKTLSEAPAKQSVGEQKQDKRTNMEIAQPVVSSQENRQVESMEVSSEKTHHSTPTMPDNSVVVEKQKAIVKPHILTHVIEGFIIHEGPEPFPVQRSSLLTEFIPPKAASSNATTTTTTTATTTTTTTTTSSNNNNNNNNNNNTEKESEQEETNGSSHDPDVPMIEETETGEGDGEDHPPEPDSTLKCEFCGKVDVESKFRRSKRFCSMACAKRYNVGCTRRLALFKPKSLLGSSNVDKRMSSGSGPKYVKRRKAALKVRKTWRPGRVGRLSYKIASRLPPEEQSSSHSSHESSSSPTSPAQPTEYDVGRDSPTTHPAKWTVQKVFDFIKSMTGCTAYAEEFRSQEIDGQALLLLKEDHLMTAMNMKLGPALKICAHINSLKDNF